MPDISPLNLFFIQQVAKCMRTCYNVRKGQSQVSEYISAELARADMYSDI